MKFWLLEERADGERIGQTRIFQALSSAIETGEAIVRERYDDGIATTETIRSNINGEDSYEIYDEDHDLFAVIVWAAPLE